MGTACFAALGSEGREAVYRSLESLTTAEVEPTAGSEGERLFSAGLRIGAAVFYLVLVGSVVQAVVVRQALAESYRERRRRARVDAMTNHYIVCGFGRVGRAVVRALRADGVPVVVVEAKESNRAEAEDLGAEVVLGDADAAETLTAAGVARARGLIACVGSDAVNVYIALAARRCSPDIRVVVRASDADSEKNLRSATELIDRVISPYESMGDHLARALLDKDSP